MEQAAWSLFDVSAIIWIAAYWGLVLIGRGEGLHKTNRADRIVGSVAVILSLIPQSYAAWIGLIICVAWLLGNAKSPSPMVRGTRILLAITVPLFWAKLAFAFAGNAVLRTDAFVTALILGMPSNGNMVQFADRSGYFQIYPACSSLVNMSLALLAWWTVVNLVPRIALTRVAGVAVAMGLCVFLINIVRLVAIGTFRPYFDIIHGDIGNTVVGWFTLAVVAIVCWLGIRSSIGPAMPGGDKSDQPQVAL
ncbi:MULTISPECIES: exosortase/archaeosortase family protein [unclassified Rhizobium]|uniref:exosortase/archaeosortase family protein n=1 Tax=unclassified Rhizobium TaxID=2613769 RepID=UPI00138F1B32|nr:MULTISPECIES: exosortase/archaeosortase family protein [unclassified Rhizobium]